MRADRPLARRPFLGALAACAAGLPLAASAADTYPSRPLRFVVNFPPGGASDIMARLFALKLGEALRQSILIDNRPGAGGAIGTVYAAHQPADGYTFMIGTLGSTIVQPLLTKVPYDMARDFMPVSLIGTGPAVLVVNPASPWRDLPQFIAAAKARPEGLNFGSGGNGTFGHLVGEMVNQAAGLHMQHVPYKGGIQALNDVMAGQVDTLAGDPQAVLPHIKSGKLRALAVSATRRFALLPEVPTFAEYGLPEVVAVNSWSIYLPAGVPQAEFRTFRAALDKAMTDPDLVRRFTELGAESLHTSPEELRRFTAGETVKYARLIKEKDIKGE